MWAEHFVNRRPRLLDNFALLPLWLELAITGPGFRDADENLLAREIGRGSNSRFVVLQLVFIPGMLVIVVCCGPQQLLRAAKVSKRIRLRVELILDGLKDFSFRPQWCPGVVAEHCIKRRQHGGFVDCRVMREH